MFKNLKINMKLFVGFGIVLFFMLICVIMSFSNMSTMGNQITQYVEKTVPNNNYVWELRRNLVSIQRFMLIALTETDAAAIQENLDMVAQEAKAVTETLEIYKKNARVEEAKLNELSTLIGSMGTYRSQITDLLAKGDDKSNTEAYQIFKSSYKPLIDDAASIMEEFGNTQNDLANVQAEDAADARTFSTAVLIIVSLVSFGVAFYIIFAIRKAILTPVLEIEKASKMLAAGDLSAEITYDGRDELGSLAEATGQLVNTLKTIIQDINYCLGHMADGDFRVSSNCKDQYVGDYAEILQAMSIIKNNLSSTLKEINEASNQVSSASEQVSSSAQELANGATDQASSIQELSATITDLSNKIQLNAENAKDASNLSTEAGTETQQSNKYMQDMIKAMQEIESASKEIENIINAIDDIATQTNLLSLNAAIEAARAGDAGKGFAVVAGEVGNLANESAEAVKNTAALISKTIQAVENGTRIVNDTAVSLQKVIEKTQMVGDKIYRITEASEEQAMASEQLTQGVDQIASVVQTNAATAEESSAASEELNAQAQMLKEQIGKFKL